MAYYKKDTSCHHTIAVPDANAVVHLHIMPDASLTSHSLPKARSQSANGEMHEAIWQV
jgi:hypothetical protein